MNVKYNFASGGLSVKSLPMVLKPFILFFTNCPRKQSNVYTKDYSLFLR